MMTLHKNDRKSMGNALRRMWKVVGCAVLLIVTTASVRADGLPVTRFDGKDARLLGFDGTASLPPDAPKLDLIRHKIGAWAPDNPTQSLFRGMWCPAPADFFRLDLVFNGLVNPPGLDFPTNIFFFGDNPLLGFVEFDVDGNVLTGGELVGPQFRFHGAASRFGGLPNAPRFSGRMSQDSCPGTNDANISTGPYFPERSGEEFDLAFLWGSVASLDVGTNGDFVFEPGEVWTIRGPFLQRARGFDDFILLCCSNGLPTYVPEVELLFSHSIVTNKTTVSLVYPLTQAGSAAIAGDAPEPADCCADNQNSITEALDHLVLSVQLATAIDQADVNFPLIADWGFQVPADFLDPVGWKINAVFVSAFTDVDTLTAGLAWSDIVPNVMRQDYNGDKIVDTDDEASFDAFLASQDGGACDADGVVDGVFSIIGFGNGFDIHDTNYDGVVDIDDRPPGLDAAVLFDADGDGDLDLKDYAILQRCVQVEGAELLNSCEVIDTDGDGTVSLGEIEFFGQSMGGPGVFIAVPANMMQIN